ncbi:MAG: trehalase family glycosidase [Armatimonadota bacterium]|nr:trehalase family glycosidase [Armatimonadota bacterium]MDR7451236.1 trehalase family glycosidase [Armatimonadota bacterium]MDR7466861.1 trehalase family glycosidase [Armatimonadota bacterium]MDR7492666.1 trehalase family glycosidase [Armatimonadota bacterium]MDR7499972.1 trehalase family glycosidase [Armatimonadota bacterium]
MTADRELLRRAQEILQGNDVGGAYTKPSPRLYPHQWNWDSAFAALGWARIDWSRAIREIETLLLGQWTNGMVPHIRYNPEVTDYAPGPEWWPGVPVRRAGQITSGISQPCVLGSASYRIGLLAPDASSRQAWWAKVHEALVDALLYFLRHRTAGGNPLIVVVHPWESGLDNSPRWDFATGKGYRPSRPYRRVDTTIVDPLLRPTGKDYDLYMYLVELLADVRYDLAAYLQRTPFAVYDALFNAVWYRSALDLNRIAAALGRPPAVDPARLAAFRDAYRRTLWEESAGLFRDWDLRAGRSIPVDTIAGLTAIYAGLVDRGQAAQMLAGYRRRCRGCLLLPSVPPDQAGFDPARYWRGPVWVNTNWMVIQGLRDLALHREADELTQQTLTLVRSAGFHEYFHAHDGRGLGGGEFTWSAALVIDLLHPAVGAGREAEGGADRLR